MITHPWRSILGDVPANWEVTTLKAVLARSAAGSWGEDRGEVGMPVLRSTNFTSERRIDVSESPIRRFDRVDASRFDILKNDILLERSGGGPTQPVGRVVLIDSDLREYGYSNFVQLLRINDEKMDPNYVAWVLYQLHRSNTVERLQHQTTQMRNLDFRDYLQVQIPNPPMAVQRVIAACISAADAALQRFRQQLDNVNQLRTSLLQTMFIAGRPGAHSSYSDVTILRQHYSIPTSWRLERLGNLVAAVEYGTNAPSRDQGGWPVVAIPQVIAPVLVRGDWPNTLIPQAEADRLRLEADDVLLIRTNGNADYIGKSTVVTAELAREHIVFASYLIRVRTDASKLLGPFLNLFLASPLGRRQLAAVANTSAGNHNLGSRALKQMAIPLPTIDEQARIVAYFDAAGKGTDALRAKVASGIAMRDALLQNLLTGLTALGDEVTR